MSCLPVSSGSLLSNKVISTLAPMRTNTRGTWYVAPGAMEGARGTSPPWSGCSAQNSVHAPSTPLILPPPTLKKYLHGPGLDLAVVAVGFRSLSTGVVGARLDGLGALGSTVLGVHQASNTPFGLQPDCGWVCWTEYWTVGC